MWKTVFLAFLKKSMFITMDTVMEKVELFYILSLCWQGSIWKFCSVVVLESFCFMRGISKFRSVTFCPCSHSFAITCSRSLCQKSDLRGLAGIRNSSMCHQQRWLGGQKGSMHSGEKRIENTIHTLDNRSSREPHTQRDIGIKSGAVEWCQLMGRRG